MTDDLLAALGFRREPWQADALCREYPDVDWFATSQADEAKAVCQRCLVRQECLDHAMTHDERHGVWGGHDEDERRAMRKRAA